MYRSVKGHVASLISGAKGQHEYSPEYIILEAGLELQFIKDLEAKRSAKEEEQRREAAALLTETTGTGSIPEAGVSEVDDGASRKRRRGGKSVDYAALDKELRNA